MAEINTEINDESLTAAKKAREKVAAVLLTDPHVSLIDIGWDSDKPQAPVHQRKLAVRVHLKSEDARKQVKIPDQVDGVPVRVIIADYQLE